MNSIDREKRLLRTTLNGRDVIHDMPSTISMQMKVSRINCKTYGKVPEFPEDFADIDGVVRIPNHLMRVDGELFIQSFDVIPADRFHQIETLMIVGSDLLLRYLAATDRVLMDGTFKTCPAPWFQMFCMHILIGLNSIMVVTVFLSSKSKRIYIRMLHLLSNRFHELGVAVKWTTVMTDFESGLRPALYDFLDAGTALPACYFHFTKSNIKEIGQIGLIVLYEDKDDPWFRNFVRRLLCLAYLPIERVIPVFALLINHEEFKHQLQTNELAMTYLDYFVKVYLENDGANCFVPQDWNISDEGNQRTNNHAESWNKYWQLKVGTHKNFWQSLEYLQEEAQLNMELIRKYRDGYNPDNRRLRQRIKDDRIKEILRQYGVGEYNNREVEFLKALANQNTHLLEDGDSESASEGSEED